MDTTKAAKRTREAYIPTTLAERSKDGKGLSHAAWLLDMVAEGRTKNDGQANRWLAWAQCLLNSGGVADLAQLKILNKFA